MTPLMLGGFPGPWTHTDQAIWGKRKAAGLWPPAEEVREGGLALLAWGQGCGIYNRPGACKCLVQLFHFEAMSN